MLIYTQHITPRLSYIVKELLGKDVVITINKEEFVVYAGTKFNYSHEPIDDVDFWLKPNDLLFQQDIQEQNIDVFEWNGLKAFYGTEGFVPFDFLAASFYLISRYEEYLPHEKDMYGRYAHTNSIAFKHNFLHLPLVNLWLKAIKNQFPNFTIHHSPFTFVPTYDIDIAFAYKHHSSIKNAFGFLKDIVQLNSDKALERLMVYANKSKDPFDTFDWLHQLHQQYQLKPLYFFLLAAKRKGYDKNLSPTTKAMKLLMQQHAQLYSVGIHPSWQSGDDENLLEQEINILQQAINKKVSNSRQHYIRMSLPTTYEILIAKGIEEEYSMGYGSINGFRASYCKPFKWYNLAKEEATTLNTHSFCFMEANSFFEQQYSANDAAIEFQEYLDVVKKTDGELISIFHNHFITEQPEWIAWRSMYKNFLEENFTSK